MRRVEHVRLEAHPQLLRVLRRGLPVRALRERRVSAAATPLPASAAELAAAVPEREYLRLLGLPRGRALEGDLRERARRRARLVRRARPAVRGHAAGGRHRPRAGHGPPRHGSGASRALPSPTGCARARPTPSSPLPRARAARWPTRRAASGPSDRPDEAFFLDRFAVAVTERLVFWASAPICRASEPARETLLPHLSPGCGHWDLADQHRTHGPPDRRGRRHGARPRSALLPSGALRPQHSLLAALGVTRRSFAATPEDLCRSCDLDPCAFRRAPCATRPPSSPGDPMSRPPLMEALKTRVLLGDGAMGTQLQNAGLESGHCGEAWNVDHPDRVLENPTRLRRSGLGHPADQHLRRQPHHAEPPRRGRPHRGHQPGLGGHRPRGPGRPRLRAGRHRSLRRPHGALRRDPPSRRGARLPRAGQGPGGRRSRRHHHRDPDRVRGAGDRHRRRPRGGGHGGHRLDRLRQDGRRGRRADDDGHQPRAGRRVHGRPRLRHRGAQLRHRRRHAHGRRHRRAATAPPAAFP